MSKTSKQLRVAALAAAVALGLGSATVAANGAANSGTQAVEMKRVWVKFKPGFKANVKKSLTTGNGKIHHEFDRGIDAFAVTLPVPAIEALKRNKHVEYVEDDVLRYPFAEAVPYGIPQVQADDAVDVGADGEGVKVCIIDSGIKSDHEDFANVVMTGDAATGKTWSEDTCGHGTHVAGTIAAVGGNAIGVVGVSPGKASLHIVKYFDGTACTGGAYSSTLVAAAQSCKDAGAKVINMSLGGGFSSTTEQAAFTRFYNEGVLSVAAAGNSGNTTKSYPASYTDVVSVAALDQNSVHGSFSQYNDAVDIAAPGVEVLSTSPRKATPITINGQQFEAYPLLNMSPSTVTAELVDGGFCNEGSTTWTGKVIACERGGTSTSLDKIVNVNNSGGKAIIFINNREYPIHTGIQPNTTGYKITGVVVNNADGLALRQLAGQNVTVNPTWVVDVNQYVYMSGTSMASPHVAGVAALLFSAKPGATPAQVREALTSTALDLGDPGRDNKYGYGLVQAFDAVEKLLGSGTPPANQAPVADFISSASGLTVNFTDTSTDSDGSIASRAWTFGDGTSSTSANPSKTYSAAGTYSVKLTVTDDDGATHSVTKSVTVSAPSSNQAPVANFTSSVSNLTASFTDTSTDSDGSIASRSWDFGDATSSTLANPSHTYAAAGTYTVKLTVTDNNGATNTKTGSVTVTAASSGAQTYTNGLDVTIPNFGSGISSIEVTERAGKASSTTAVRVKITHPDPSHLSIKLIAPDGTSLYLLSYMQGTAASLDKTYTVDLSTKDLNGTWKLDVRDFTGGTVGTIDNWSITF